MEVYSGGGGGTQSRKGTDCGLTAKELWLSRAAMADKGELSSPSILQ